MKINMRFFKNKVKLLVWGSNLTLVMVWNTNFYIYIIASKIYIYTLPTGGGL